MAHGSARRDAPSPPRPWRRAAGPSLRGALPSVPRPRGLLAAHPVRVEPPRRLRRFPPRPTGDVRFRLPRGAHARARDRPPAAGPGCLRLPARLPPRHRPRARGGPSLGRHRPLGLPHPARRDALGPSPRAGPAGASSPASARPRSRSPSFPGRSSSPTSRSSSPRVPQAHWWTDLLRGNLLLSLAYANPIVPALGLVVGALVCLSRFEETGDRGHLGLAALQAAAVPFFKVFLGAHLLLGLGCRLAPGAPGAAPGAPRRRPALRVRDRRPRLRPGRRHRERRPRPARSRSG